MATKKRSGKPFFVISRGNVKVPGYRRKQRKNGTVYITYAVPDYSCGGKRRLHSFSDLAKAKEKAGSIADAILAGDPGTLKFDDLRLEIRRSLEALEPTGLNLLPAAQLVAAAAKILGGHEDLLTACTHWVQHRPDRPFTPKKASEAKAEFLERKTKVSARRHRTLSCYLNTFVAHFGQKCLHEISPVELKDTWQQVLRGMETGFIYLESAQTKTNQPRSVPIQENLKLWLHTWLFRHPRVSGPVLPTKWAGIQRLDEITRYVSRNCGVVWRDNAPRHSFGTYFFRLGKDAGAVVKAMGNSLIKFERHYWNKAESITEEAAREWFAIVPPAAANVVPMSASG